MPTRYPNGVTTARATETLGRYGLPAPMKWHTFFDDFDTFAAGDWVITTTEAGAGSATEAITDEDGGVLLLTNAAGDNDRDFLQLTGETFSLEANKRVIFRARFKVSDATESDVIMGLQITDTTPLDVSDGVFFQKDDGDTNLDFHVEKNGTATTVTGITTLSDDTFVDVGFDINGLDSITAYINDARVQEVAVTNIPDDEVLTVSFGIQNGEAVAKTMSTDFIFCAKER